MFLLACAVVFGVSYRIADRSENHSYNAGATPHFPVHVTLGKQYELSTPGGLDALNRQGIVAGSVACTWSGGGIQSSLGISSLAGTRTVHAFATFTGPTTGEISIRCANVPELFVDDADNAASDPAGLFVLLATVSLTAGAALAMSELYRRSTAKRNRATATRHAAAMTSPLDQP